jgi:hypothetical protein
MICLQNVVQRLFTKKSDVYLQKVNYLFTESQLFIYKKSVVCFQKSICFLGLKGMTSVKKSDNSKEDQDPGSSSPTPPPSATYKEPTGELSLSSFMGTSPKDAMTSSSGKLPNVPIVYSEDKSTDTKKHDMEAMAACTKDDVLFRNWLIRFVNSQMLLKGLFTKINCLFT